MVRFETGDALINPKSLFFLSDITSAEHFLRMTIMRFILLNSIQKYREGRIHLLINQNILKSWIIRFEAEYFFRTNMFEP
jgi:uncharacterized protein YbgA (DUF1722 family)